MRLEELKYLHVNETYRIHKMRFLPILQFYNNYYFLFEGERAWLKFLVLRRIQEGSFQ
ncbi:Uncharacterised protein [Acinetobacter baumannii]|nr:Uncharacterised protein [Acinetobacter baumannii]SSS40684.1 Uncharacterised protein [Acinetobacter baumannii]SVK01581.1 Uncharacterised protein [Acinetobacter baumannii]